MKLNIDETIQLLLSLKDKNIKYISGDKWNYHFLVDGEIIKPTAQYNDTDYMTFTFTHINKNIDVKIKLIDTGINVEFRVVGFGGSPNIQDAIAFLKWIKVFGFVPSVTIKYESETGLKYKWTTSNISAVILLLENNKIIEYKIHRKLMHDTIPKIS